MPAILMGPMKKNVCEALIFEHFWEGAHPSTSLFSNKVKDESKPGDHNELIRPPEMASVSCRNRGVAGNDSLGVMIVLLPLE